MHDDSPGRSQRSLSPDRETKLHITAAAIARFCELIAVKLKHPKSNLFWMGMLSLMDAILEVSIGVLVEGLCLDPEIKAQLLCAKTDTKTPLSPIYDLMVARETGDWEVVTGLGKQLNLSLFSTTEIYNEAMRWAHQVAGQPQAQGR